MDNDKQQHIAITHSNVQVVPTASEASMNINPAEVHPVPAASQHFDMQSQTSATIRYYITHDAVGVPELIRQARRHIVLHAAFYPKYGFDNQGDDVSKAMSKNPNLRLTAIFTDVKAPWVDEFAVTLRDYFAKKGEFAKHLKITKDHFVRLRNQFGTKRVRIYDTARLPLFRHPITSRPTN